MPHRFRRNTAAFLKSLLLLSILLSGSASRAHAHLHAPLAINPPLNLRATAVTSTSLRLEWNRVAGASSYRLYRSTLPDQGFLWIGSIQQIGTLVPFFTDQSLINQVIYYYKVGSLTSSGVESSASQTLPVMPGLIISNAVLGMENAEYTPGGDAPLVLTARYEVSDESYLYGIPSKIISQVVYRPDTLSPGDWVYLADAHYTRPSATCCFRQVQAEIYPDPSWASTPGQYQYTFRFSGDLGRTWIYAGNNARLEDPVGATGGMVRILTVKTDLDDAPPTVEPANIRLSNIKSTSVTVEWDPGADAEGRPLLFYDIYRSTNGAPPVLAGRVLASQTSFHDSGLSGDANYQYTVRAVDGGFNYSSPSDPQTNPPGVVTTLPSPVRVTLNITVPPFTPFTTGMEGVYLNRIIDRYGTNGETTWTGTYIPCDPIRLVCTRAFDVQQGAEFRFQISRGSIQTVETTADGHIPIPERQVLVQYAAAISLNFNVQNWDDPLVTAHTPRAGTAPVPDSISLTWNQIMPSGTIITVERRINPDPPVYTPVSGSFSLAQNGMITIFTPEIPFGIGQTIRARCADAEDLKGIAQQSAHAWEFNTIQNRILLPAVLRP